MPRCGSSGSRREPQRSRRSPHRSLRRLRLRSRCRSRRQPLRPLQRPGAQAAKKAAWQARKSALSLRLRKLSPALFAARAAPFAIGINTEIIRRLELLDIQDLRALGVILHFTVTHPRYLRALAAEGAMRHDLDGNPVEPVSAEHRELAQAMLDKLACKAKPKKQADENHE